MVKLPDVTHAAIILTGTHGQENLLVSRFEEKDCFLGLLIHVFSESCSKEPSVPSQIKTDLGQTSL